MKHGLAVVVALFSLAVIAASGRADDSWKQNQNHGSQFKNPFGRGSGAKPFQKFSDAIHSWKKKNHNNQPPQDSPKPPVTPFPPIITDPIPPKPPVTPFPPIVTDPRPRPRPIVNDHRNPTRPSWGKPIDTSGAPGGTVVTDTPIIRDHRQPKPWGTTSGGVFGNGTAKPIVRDHRDGAGKGGVSVSDILGGDPNAPVIRDHRDAPVVRDHRK